MYIKTKKVEDIIFSSSTCTRCGKQRIIAGSYEEKTETSVVTYTVAICSDPECQKIVDKTLKEEERKRSVVRVEQERREALRKEAMAEKKRAAASI